MVWVIRLYDPMYDYKLYRNYVKHTTQAGSPLISTHHVNERKQSQSTSLGVFYFKRRCAEWSVNDIKVLREPFESIGSIWSLIALTVL